MYKATKKILCRILSFSLILLVTNLPVFTKADNASFSAYQIETTSTVLNEKDTPIGDLFKHEWRLRYQSYIEAYCPVNGKLVSGYYGNSGQRYWSTSYASSGYYAAGWNTSCNSWGTSNLALGGLVTDSWIHSHAGQTVNVAQTFRSY